MGRLMNYLRGMAQVRAEGPFPERLINLCAQANIDFWGWSGWTGTPSPC